tara:strand:- start:14 stop:337 length:324 start_codon:yes stop_codon:yes gene_type:complete
MIKPVKSLGLDDSHQIWRTAMKKRGEDIRAAVVARLRTGREDQGLSNRQLSIRSGLSRATIRNIESGTQSPSLETLIMLAEGLGANLPDMIHEETAKRKRQQNPSAE